MAKAKVQADRDIPLLLRRRWVKFDDDGNGTESALFLNDPQDRGWPPCHEFDKDWLLRNSGNGVTVEADTIIVELGDGSRGVYRVDHERNEESRATGIWANLDAKESTVNG